MKILIIRLSSLGDVILTQSVCAYLRAQYPDAEIDFITKAAYIEIIKLMGLDIQPISYSQSLSAHIALFKKRYDLVLDLHGKLASRLISLAACGKKSAVYNKQRKIRKKIVSGNKALCISSTLDLYKSALKPFFTLDKLPVPRLVNPENMPDIKLPESKKLIMIFPGAQHYTKMYPLEYYQELIQISPADYYFLLAGSPAERGLCQKLQAQATEKALNIAGNYSFGELLSIISHVDIVISSDSGPMHLAAAIQKKQIAIFGATHPRLGFAPLNPNARLLLMDLECQPCSLHGSERCSMGHFKCMRELKPETLLNAMQESLSGLIRKG